MEETSTTTTKNEEVVTFKRSHFYSVMVVFAFAAGILVGYLAWGRTTPSRQVAAQGQSQPSAAQAPANEAAFTRYDIPIDGYPSLGPDDAPIVIVEFSDFQCPFCKRWHDQVYRSLLDAYPGQIRLVYRNLPLTSIHPEALPAAVASLCADEQDSFWPYHDKLFSSENLGRSIYLQYAQDLTLDVDAFESCLDSGNFDNFIRADMDFSLNLGVQSTPTFFINGLAIVGAQPLSVFQQVIDQELAGEIP